MFYMMTTLLHISRVLECLPHTIDYIHFKSCEGLRITIFVRGKGRLSNCLNGKSLSYITLIHCAHETGLIKTLLIVQLFSLGKNTLS